MIACFLFLSDLFEICPEMHALAKMAEMAISRQNRQTINKNSNEMAKGPFAKWRFWRKWQKWQLIAKIAKLYNKFVKRDVREHYQKKDHYTRVGAE